MLKSSVSRTVDAIARHSDSRAMRLMQEREMWPRDATTSFIYHHDLTQKLATSIANITCRSEDYFILAEKLLLCPKKDSAYWFKSLLGKSSVHADSAGSQALRLAVSLK